MRSNGLLLSLCWTWQKVKAEGERVKAPCEGLLVNERPPPVDPIWWGKALRLKAILGGRLMLLKLLIFRLAQVWGRLIIHLLLTQSFRPPRAIRGGDSVVIKINLAAIVLPHTHTFSPNDFCFIPACYLFFPPAVIWPASSKQLSVFLKPKPIDQLAIKSKPRFLPQLTIPPIKDKRIISKEEITSSTLPQYFVGPQKSVLNKATRKMIRSSRICSTQTKCLRRTWYKT